MDSSIETALGHLESGHYEDALEILQDLTVNTPGDANAWLFLGEVFLRVDEQQRALLALENACKLEPNNPTLKQLQTAFVKIVEAAGGN